MVDEVSKGQNLDKTNQKQYFTKKENEQFLQQKYTKTQTYFVIYTNSHNNNTKSNEWLKYVILFKKRTY